MAFYQSSVRRDIQAKIYKKELFTLHIFDKDYIGTIKTKKIGPLALRRYQILDINLPHDPKTVHEAIQQIKKTYNKPGDLFFQRGITNCMLSFDSKDLKCDEFKQEMRAIRGAVRKNLHTTYKLHHAPRENMPEAGLEYDLQKTDEEFLADMDSGCKQRVKKAIKQEIWQEITFSICDPKDEDAFYAKRQKTAGSKWFNIIPKHQFKELTSYLTGNNKGHLFIASHEREIIAGSICIFDEKRIIFLYGFHDANYNNIGSHHFLKFKIFGRGRDHGFTTGDMIGGSPTGFPEHPLHSVTTFKESMGGTKHEYYGNYDIPLNPRAYKLFKLYHNHKKH